MGDASTVADSIFFVAQEVSTIKAIAIKAAISNVLMEQLIVQLSVMSIFLKFISVERAINCSLVL